MKLSRSIIGASENRNRSNCVSACSDHAAICRELGSIGIGTMNVAATFRSPLRDGDGVDIRVSLGQARPKSLDLAYSGFVGQRLAFEGKETRALFVRSDKGISAGEIGPLVALLAGPEQSD